MLFFTLATGLYRAHRPFGIGAFAWAIVVVSFPRLYLGTHWPTDIIGGAALGITLGWLGTPRAVRDAVRRRLMPWHDQQPAVFYIGLLIVMFEVMNLFEDGREALHFLGRAAKNIL